MKRNTVFRIIICCVTAILAFVTVYTLCKFDKTIKDYEAKVEMLEEDYEKLLSAVNRDIIYSTPLKTEEAEAFSHNVLTVNSFYGFKSLRSVEIANKCFSLKREGKMESSWIDSLKEHTDYMSYYCMEVITDDGQHYWFHFEYEGSGILKIYKGENKESIIYEGLKIVQ